jgi:hypothetical protein
MSATGIGARWSYARLGTIDVAVVALAAVLPPKLVPSGQDAAREFAAPALTHGDASGARLPFRLMIASG